MLIIWSAYLICFLISLSRTHTHSLLHAEYPICLSNLLHLSLTHSHPLNILLPCLHNTACHCHCSTSPLFLALTPTHCLLPHPIYFTSFSPSLAHSTPHFLCHHPICFQLQKLAYVIKNLPTIIQPEWKKTLAKLVADATNENSKPLSIWMMPRDVVTQWNLTYKMLKFAYTYQEAINMLTDNRTLKLREYELSDDNWSLVKQLQDSLKVSIYLPFHIVCTDL